MADLPRGVPFIDLIVPYGTAAKVPDLQTRIDLVSGGGWRVRGDDGTMEDSLAPMQPLRGPSDRIQIYRQQPLYPGESLQEAAGLAIEMATDTSAMLGCLGVYGTFAWGLVLVEDARWLHGLVLLDWLYNPRLDDTGEVVEEEDPAIIEATLARKIAVFQQLWVPERSIALMQKLPPGALQQAGSHLALMLMAPGGGFDPRYWQGFSMQLALAEVREFAADPNAEVDATPLPAAPPPPPEVPAEPDDGLTPLARAELAARQRAIERAAQQGTAEPEIPDDDDIEGTPIRWHQTSRGRLLWVPADRFDPSVLKGLRSGGLDGLRRSERPTQPAMTAWMEAGAPFATEVPFLSRLFLDAKPVHKGTWEEAATQRDGYSTLSCHLPRAAPVRAILVPAHDGEARRIIVTSDLELAPSEAVEIASE